MIPYIELPDIHLVGPLTLHWFGVLVATGVVVGTWLARRRAARLGIDARQFESFLAWGLVAGFVGGHVFNTLFYLPDELVRRPWSLLFIWEGLSSFGGFAGGLIGVALWRYTHRPSPPLLLLLDIVLAVFPIAWVFGRAGCYTVHDHPGIHTTSWLAVAYPDGPRYDLGFLEMLFAAALSILFVALWRRRLPVGTYVALTGLTYAPTRFVLDFLRTSVGPDADARYFHLTPAQYACVLLFGYSLWLAYHVWQRREPPLAVSDDRRMSSPGRAAR